MQWQRLMQESKPKETVCFPQTENVRVMEEQYSSQKKNEIQRSLLALAELLPGLMVLDRILLLHLSLKVISLYPLSQNKEKKQRT